MKSYKELINSLEGTKKVRALTGNELDLLKRVMFKCYIDVAEVCRKQNITLMLGGGSALGAVRHKGYIPWDDDFDLLMPREDYERFRKIFNHQLGDKYVLHAPNYNGTTLERFPQIMIKGTEYAGIGANLEGNNNQVRLDIFILENVPDNRLLCSIKGFICTILMFIAGRVGTYEGRNTALVSFLSQTKEGRRAYINRKMIGKVFSFWPYVKWCDMIDRACQYKKKTRRLGIPTGRKHYWGEIFERNVFIPVSEGIFNSIPVNLPNDVDAYLKNLYGEYMTLPPEEKREKHYVVRFNISDMS